MMYAEINAKAIEDIYSIVEDMKGIEQAMKSAIHFTDGDSIKGEVIPYLEKLVEYTDMIEETIGKI